MHAGASKMAARPPVDVHTATIYRYIQWRPEVGQLSYTLRYKQAARTAVNFLQKCSSEPNRYMNELSPHINIAKLINEDNMKVRLIHTYNTKNSFFLFTQHWDERFKDAMISRSEWCKASVDNIKINYYSNIINKLHNLKKMRRRRENAKL